jgi:S-DNA-T family DNA segregation ATPase FtsK/SpoIIIE
MPKAERKGRKAARVAGGVRKKQGSQKRAWLEEGPFRDRLGEILGICFVGLSLFLVVSGMSYRFGSSQDPLLSGANDNWGGYVGHYIGGFFMQAFGLASFIGFAFVLFWGLLLLLRKPLNHPWPRVFGVFALVLVFSIFLSGAGPDPSGIRMVTPHGAGGLLGAFLSPRLHQSFGWFGTWLLLALTGSIAFFIATDWALTQVFADIKELARKNSEEEGAFHRLRLAFAGRMGGVLERLKRGSRAGDVEGDRSQIKNSEGKGRGGLAQEVPEAVDEDEVLRTPEPKRRRRRRKSLEASQPVGGEILEKGLAEGPVPDGSEENVEGGIADELEDSDAPIHPRERRRRRRETSSDVEEEEKEFVQRDLPIRISGQSKKRKRKRKKTARKPRDGWVFPPLDLLDPEDPTDSGVSQDLLRSSAEAIERRLASHRVEAKVVAISSGPAVTVFELELGEGQRVGSMTKFAPDLAAALKSISIRIVAPIPGKHTVGVEVPNPTRRIVRLRELLEENNEKKDTLRVPLFLGCDVAGKSMVEDLAAMPHLLIAGATGSGKSVCINSILLSILMTRTPDEVRLILIDPKMVELQNYAKIPHLMCPVVSNMKRASSVLSWVVEKMEHRYALLSAVGVRNLASYNSLGEEKLKGIIGSGYDPETTPAHLPSIVVVIDEFADLMAVAASDVEISIQRLAQKSRAVGIHVILATQRPSRDVITGLIKANLPTRIAFKVSSKTDSRVVLDANGSEQLLGNGDMLYIPPRTSTLVRAQGAFIGDDEIFQVVQFLVQQGGEPDYERSLIQEPSGKGRGAANQDELYEDAVRTVLEEQRGSATLLQRKLGIGYTRASRLIELMAEDGIVGDFQGSKSRQVMLNLEQWEAQQAGLDEDDEDEYEYEDDQDFEEGDSELEEEDDEDLEGDETDCLDADDEEAPWDEEAEGSLEETDSEEVDEEEEEER